MPRRAVPCAWLLLGSLLVSAAGAGSARREPLPLADLEALKAVATGLFAAYAKKDLEALSALISAGSPERAARLEEARRLFAAAPGIALESVEVTRAERGADAASASLRAAVTLRGADPRTGTPAPGTVKGHVTLVCAREGDAWKLVRLYPTAREVAAALLAAAAPARAALLEAEKALLGEVVEALSGEGEYLISRNQPAAALPRLELALEIAAGREDLPGQARAQIGIGRALVRADVDGARNRFRAALELGERAGSPPWIAASLGNLAALHQMEGDYDTALAMFTRLLPVMLQAGDARGAAATRLNIGLVHARRGSYREGLDACREALAAFRASDDGASAARVLETMGSIHLLLQDYGAALDACRQAREGAEAAGDRAVLARVDGLVGTIHETRGNYSRALAHYEKSLAVSTALADAFGIAGAQRALAMLHARQGDHDQALEYHRKALEGFQAAGSREEAARTLAAIGVVQQMRNDPEAVETLRRSRAEFQALKDPRTEAGICLALGAAHAAMNETAEALALCEQALQLYSGRDDREGRAVALVAMAHLEGMRGNQERALELASRAAEAARETGQREALWQARGRAGIAHAESGRFEEARAAFREAIQVIESLREDAAGGEQEQQRFFSERVDPYSSMVHLLAGAGRDADALHYAERLRGRVLLDALQGGRERPARFLTSAERRKERELTAALISLNAQLARERARPDAARAADLEQRREKARLALQAFRAALRAAHPELRARRGETRTVTLKEAAALLPDARGALLEFTVTPETTYLFVLRKKSAAADVSLKVFPVRIRQQELESRARAFRQDLQERRPGFAARARALYDLLIAPARGELAGATTLGIVADGALWELPFQALQSPARRYLLEDAAVYYAPSLSVLREMRKRRASGAPASLLAVGNPLAGEKRAARREGAGALPEAEQEVRLLEKLYGPGKSRVLTGAAARERPVKSHAARYGILHFAAHGLLDNRSPMYSHMQLAAGEEGEDGRLEAWEMMDLELNARLVVLSGCDTARGAVSAGEGMIGMAWSLFVAGCPRAVVSQWKVDSAGTRRLMVDFHRRLLGAPAGRGAAKAKPAGTAEALRQAALALLRDEKTRHPYFWAPFVLVGDPG